jgi:hypothetical protein
VGNRLGIVGGFNTYAYVDSQPTLYVDPDGLQRVWPLPIPSFPGGGGSGGGTTRPIDPSEPGGPSFSPGFQIPSFGEWFRDGMESRKSDKEASTKRPSWADNYPMKPGENCDDWATRILEEKYGCGDSRAKFRGPGSEHSQLKKSCQRHR